MNTWIVKPVGEQWAVRSESETEHSGPMFDSEESAIRFAREVAESNRPARIQIYDTHALRAEINFPRLSKY